MHCAFHLWNLLSAGALLDDNYLSRIARSSARNAVAISVASEASPGATSNPWAARFGLKVLDLQLDDDEAAQPQVIEQKIQIVVLATNLEWMLATDERKAFAELKDQRA